MGHEREFRLGSELKRLADELAPEHREEAINVPGKRTLVELLLDRLAPHDPIRRERRVPGKQTLSEHLPASTRISFDDLRVQALREVLCALAGRRDLQIAVAGAADPVIARRTTRFGQVRTADAGADGRAMWQVSERRAATLYRRALDSGEVSPADAAIAAALARAGSGTSLPADVRHTMEGMFGVSFARVRIHTDHVAADACRAVRADAFTVGEDIFFADNAYAPASPGGQKLLAHELTHVVQTWQGRTPSDLGGVRVIPHDHPLEQEASAAAERFAGRRSDGFNGDAPAAASPTEAGPATHGLMPFAPMSRVLQRAAASHASEPRTDPGTARRARVHRAEPASPPTPAASQPVREPSTERGDLVAHAHRTADASRAQLETAIDQKPPAATGASSREHGKQLQRTAEDHQRAMSHARHRHRAVAHEHMHVKHHDGDDGVRDHDRVNPHSPIEFKRIDDWSRYMPPAMPDQDERERTRIRHLVQRKVEDDRREARKALATLQLAHLKQAAAIRDMRTRLQAQIASAQRAALAQIANAEATLASDIAAASGAAQARVHGAAGAARALVSTAYATTMAAIHAAQRATGQQLDQGRTAAQADVDAACTQERQVVRSLYDDARSQVTDAGTAEAAQARALADHVQFSYTGDKLDAAEDAAHQTSDTWADQVPGQMQQLAQARIYSHKTESEFGVYLIAFVQRLQITSVHEQCKTALGAAHRQAVTGASTAHTQALAQIDALAASACASLAEQSDAQIAAVHHQASAARAGIVKAGTSARAAIGRACNRAAAGIEQGARDLVLGASRIEEPDPEQTDEIVARGRARLRTRARSAIDELRTSTRRSVHGLAAEATAATKGMAATAGAAASSLMRTAQTASQSIARTGQSASRSLHAMGDAFVRQAHGIGHHGESSFRHLVHQVHEIYRTATRGIADHIKAQVHTIKAIASASINSDELVQILANAKQAADAVKPLWEKILDGAAVVTAIVAVTVLTDGIGTGAAAEAAASLEEGAAASDTLAAGETAAETESSTSSLGKVASRALRSGLSNGAVGIAGRLTDNLVNGRNLFDDFSLKDIGIDILAGVLGDGLAARFETLGGGALVRIGVDFATGLASDVAVNLAINHSYDFDLKNLLGELAGSAVKQTAWFKRHFEGGDVQHGSASSHPTPEAEAPEIDGSEETPPPAPHPVGAHSAASGDHIAKPALARDAPHQPDAPSAATAPARDSLGSTVHPSNRAETSPRSADRGAPGSAHLADEAQTTPARPLTSEHDAGKAPAPHHNQPPPGDDRSHQEDRVPGSGHAADRDGEAHEPHTRAPTGTPGNARIDARPARQEPQSGVLDQDAVMTADGYPQGTRAKAEETADRIEAGASPAKDGLRDTEANARGRSSLDKLRADPELTPAQRAQLNKALASRLRTQPDPTGDLERDLRETQPEIERQVSPLASGAPDNR